MPLPNITQRCRAKAKSTQSQCHNPAAFGMPTCRLHGARRPHTILKGEAHPNYRHGNETQERRRERRVKMAELRKLEELIQKLGMMGP